MIMEFKRVRGHETPETAFDVVMAQILSLDSAARLREAGGNAHPQLQPDHRRQAHAGAGPHEAGSVGADDEVRGVVAACIHADVTVGCAA